LALLPAYVAAGRFERPLPAMLGELLRIRRWLALEAVRLAATYATHESLAPARQIIASLGAHEGDTLAHSLAELELYRSLAHASAIWPAVWLTNAFWGP